MIKSQEMKKRRARNVKQNQLLNKPEDEEAIKNNIQILGVVQAGGTVKIQKL
jgi:hypothetical protein